MVKEGKLEPAPIKSATSPTTAITALRSCCWRWQWTAMTPDRHRPFQCGSERRLGSRGETQRAGLLQNASRSTY
jgi:hypothetical protein